MRNSYIMMIVFLAVFVLLIPTAQDAVYDFVGDDPEASEGIVQLYAFIPELMMIIAVVMAGGLTYKVWDEYG